MEFLNGIYSAITQLSKESPIIAGLVSLWGMAVITFVLRNVPKEVFNFIKRQATSSLEFNNSGWGANQRQFNSFMHWYAKTNYFKWSRYLSLETEYVYDKDTGRDNLVPVIGAGYGKHFFFFEGRLYWFNKVALDSSGSEKEKQSIVISTLGRNKQYILNLIDSFKIKPSEEDISIYTFKDCWQVLTTIKKRNIESVILNKELKDKITGDIKYFYDNPDWYTSRGLAHKQTYLLHGKPGTGKSSTIKALASYYEKNICILDMPEITGSAFEKALATAPKGSFILMEDFDSCAATKSREFKSESSILDDIPSLSLSKILNVLDGVVSLDGTIIFMTTNHPEQLDRALVRTGRVDYTYEIKAFDDAEVRDYITLMYGPQFLPEDVLFDNITGSDIQAKFLEAKDNPAKFIDSLKKQNTKK